MRWHWPGSVRELGLQDRCSRVKLLGSATLPGGGVKVKQHSGEEQSKPVVCSLRRSGFSTLVITAPPKPLKQTQILLDTMSKSADDEKNRWDQVMEQFDLLFSRVNDIGEVQQQLKTQMDIRGAAMDHYSAEQHMIAQQVKANGAAVAQLTMRQFDHEDRSDGDESVSMIFEEQDHFQNVFAKDKEPRKPESSKIRKPPPKTERKDSLPRQTMPKMQFPTFDGTNPKIWKDKCKAYFDLYQLPEGMWITVATLHFEGNAAKWFLAYKQNHTFRNWTAFCSVVEEEFGADDFRSAMNDLQELKQTRTVEEYTSLFQALQFDITMHNPHYDDMFFTPKYVMGLKEEIRGTVEAQLPATVQKASIIARIQQGVLERSKSKYSRTANHTKPYVPPKNDNKPPQHQSTL